MSKQPRLSPAIDLNNYHLAPKANPLQYELYIIQKLTLTHSSHHMKKKPTPATVRSKMSLEQQAQSLSDSGKYKDAIELYKQLLKDTDNPEWRQRLAYCYLQRAKTFALKKMHKEALVLWENYCQHAQPPYESYDHYLIWTIQAKKPDSILSSLEQLTAQQLDKDYPELAALLGLMILTEHPEFQQALPRDSAFIAHLNIVQTALQAYRDNDLDSMNQALKKLPYRSAFRDLRTLLKAGTSVSASIEETRSLLGKIPAYSPYSQSVRLLATCTLKGSAMARKMLAFSPHQRKLVGDIIGLTRQQIELVESLSKQKDRLSDKIKFNLAIQFKSLFGPELAQRFCFATLIHYPAGRRVYAKAFGAIDEFEKNRLKALACEREHNLYDADYFWRQCVKALATKGKDNGLKIALILRHRVESQPEPFEQIPLLIESLEHDPDDKDCYLRIIRYYSQQPDMADSYKQWLDKTLGKFPNDIDTLMLAIQAATRNKAHKKVIQYATKILKIDPLNTFAKQVVFSSHLAHARHLLKIKKYHSVEHEIRQAEALKIGKKYALQTQLMRAFLVFAAEDKTQGLQAITEVLDKLNADPVNAHFQAAIEALLTGLPVATLMRELPPAKDHLLSAQELTRLTQLIMQYSKEDTKPELMHKVLEKVKAPLKQSVLQQNYDENLLLTLCQTLDSIQHFELLRHCSKRAQAKWRKPIWMYYRIYSETNDDPKRCSHINGLSLQNSLEQASREKDFRTMELIGHYLDRYHEAHPSRGMGFIGNLLGEEQRHEPADPFDELFGHIPDEVFYKLEKKMASLIKKTSPERLVEELSKVIGSDRNIFNTMMQNPDLFMALMIVRAAEELNQEIGVSYGDVLDCFSVDKQTDIFSFPF